MTDGTNFMKYELYQPPSTVPGAACSYAAPVRWGTAGAEIFNPGALPSKASRTTTCAVRYLRDRISRRPPSATRWSPPSTSNGHEHAPRARPLSRDAPRGDSGLRGPPRRILGAVKSPQARTLQRSPFHATIVAAATARVRRGIGFLHPSKARCDRRGTLPRPSPSASRGSLGGCVSCHPDPGGALFHEQQRPSDAHERELGDAAVPGERPVRGRRAGRARSSSRRRRTSSFSPPS